MPFRYATYIRGVSLCPSFALQMPAQGMSNAVMGMLLAKQREAERIPIDWCAMFILLMMVQFSLTSPISVTMLPENLMRSGRACMLPLGLRPPKRPATWPS